jgi:hypothetical protein
MNLRGSPIAAPSGYAERSEFECAVKAWKQGPDGHRGKELLDICLSGWVNELMEIPRRNRTTAREDLSLDPDHFWIINRRFIVNRAGA